MKFVAIQKISKAARQGSEHDVCACLQRNHDELTGPHMLTHLLYNLSHIRISIVRGNRVHHTCNFAQGPGRLLATCTKRSRPQPRFMSSNYRLNAHCGIHARTHPQNRSKILRSSNVTNVSNVDEKIYSSEQMNEVNTQF